MCCDVIEDGGGMIYKVMRRRKCEGWKSSSMSWLIFTIAKEDLREQTMHSRDEKGVIVKEHDRL